MKFMLLQNYAVEGCEPMSTWSPEEIRAHNPDGAITGINCHLQIALRVERRMRWSKVGDHPLQVFRNNPVAAQTPRYTRRRSPCLQLCCRLSELAKLLADAGFGETQEERRTHTMAFKDEDEYIEIMVESTPLGHSIKEEDPPVQKKILAKTRANLRKWKSRKGILIPCEGVIVTATK